MYLVYRDNCFQFDSWQGAQNALLQYQARGEGPGVGANGGTVLGEGVTTDQFESRRLAASATVSSTAYESYPHRAVFVVPRCERPCRAGTSRARYSVLPSTERFVLTFRFFSLTSRSRKHTF